MKKISIDTNNITIDHKKNGIYKTNFLTKEKILYFILIFLPIIDSLNGFFIRKLNIYGIGSIYHILILIVLILFMVNSRSIIIGKYERLTIYLFISFFLSFVLNVFWGIEFTNIAIERANKILSTAIMITCLYRLQRQRIININFLDNMLDIQSILVSVIILASNFLGFYNYSYHSSQQGRIGLYTNLNETVLILTIFIFHNIKKIFNKYTNGRMVLILMLMINLMLTESKFAIGMVIVSILLIIFRILSLKKLKLKFETLIPIIAILPIGIFLIINNFQSVINKMFSRQMYLFNIYGSTNILDYLSSGRTTRFEELLINPITKMLISPDAPVNLHGAIMIFFGNGLSSDYYQTFEMDVMDVVLLSGLLGGIIFLIFNIKIIFESIKRQKKLIDCFGLIIIILGSTVVGHVWTGGVCGIYFAMLSVDFMKEKVDKGE